MVDLMNMGWLMVDLANMGGILSLVFMIFVKIDKTAVWRANLSNVSFKKLSEHQIHFNA